MLTAWWILGNNSPLCRNHFHKGVVNVALSLLGAERKKKNVLLLWMIMHALNTRPHSMYMYILLDTWEWRYTDWLAELEIERQKQKQKCLRDFFLFLFSFLFSRLICPEMELIWIVDQLTHASAKAVFFFLFCHPPKCCTHCVTGKRRFGSVVLLNVLGCRLTY